MFFEGFRQIMTGIVVKGYQKSKKQREKEKKQNNISKELKRRQGTLT